MAVSETTPTIDPDQEMQAKRAMAEVMNAQHNKQSQQAEATEAEMEEDAVLNDAQQLDASRDLHREQLTQQEARKIAAKKSAQTEEQQAQGAQAATRGQGQKKIGFFSFGIMLSFALLKDIIDFVDWGILGTVLNIIPIMGVLLTVAITGGSLMDFMNKKKYILGSGAALEFVPIIGFIPIWTVSIFWLWLEARKGRPVSGKAATRFGKKLAGGKRVQGAVKRLGLKKG